MTAVRYPPASWEPVDYAGQAGPLSTPIGWVEHVVVGDGDPWSVFKNAQSPNRRFSHLWFAKDGRIKQYQDLTRDSWAQAAGNETYWACETEGYPGQPLTDAQLDALAAWHVWSGTPDALAEAPGQRGIGTHQMGGLAWGGHACPGTIRAAQRPDIIRRAQALRGGDMPLTDAEWKRLSDLMDSKAATYADAVENRYAVKLPDGTLVNRDVELSALDALVHEVLARLGITTGGTLDVNSLATALAPALVTELARRAARA